GTNLPARDRDRANIAHHVSHPYQNRHEAALHALRDEYRNLIESRATSRTALGQHLGALASDYHLDVASRIGARQRSGRLIPCNRAQTGTPDDHRLSTLKGICNRVHPEVRVGHDGGPAARRVASENPKGAFHYADLRRSAALPSEGDCGGS